MELTNKYKRLPLAEIQVDRAARQRRAVLDAEGQFINDDGLMESIRDRGVLNPVIITDEHVLVAGERRLEASRALGLPDIPVRFIRDLSPTEAAIIELEENLKRSDLPWRDKVKAMADLHAAYLAQDPKWTQDKTQKLLNNQQLSEVLRVARSLDDPAVTRATSIREAYNVLSRRDERRMQDAKNLLAEAGASIFDDDDNIVTGQGPALSGSDVVITLPQIVAQASADDLIQANFLEWAPAYAGPKFNFIHCDFPYGTGLYLGEQSGRNRWESYDDAEATYEQLVYCFCENLDRFMLPSSHVMFWLSADIDRQWWTLEQFRQRAPSLVFWPKPLVWHKTDNVGILSDPRRGPRHVFETALIASREDRPIIQAVSDAYGAPTDKTYHPSTKPESVLRHFFRMFVDEHSTMLDPTCGSGAALRAAESLGAKRVLGLEISEEYLNGARTALRNFRNLRKVAS